MNNNNKENDFIVRFPKEYFTNWVRTEGINDGVILENQVVSIKEVSLDSDFIHIHASLLNRLDS